MFTALHAVLAGCFSLRSSQGGGQTAFDPPRQLNPGDIALPEGYRIEVVASGLDLPTGVAFDSAERPYVVEAGYSYGEVWATPRLLRVESDGHVTQVAAGTDAPWNGVTFHDGSFFVAAAGHKEGGRIVRIELDGTTKTLVDGLPSLGDHHTNGPVTGPDNWLYFGQGTATNSAVVGLDNFDFGWVRRQPEFHDIPCRDVTLAGINYTTGNPLTPDAKDTVATGAFVPFGTATRPGQVIRGRLPCSGAILRVRATGGAMELVAWGFRNPFGLGWSNDGQLYVTDNAFDVRGSRPVFGTGDLLWRVEPGAWYGWPDFHSDRQISDGNRFKPPGKSTPALVLAEHPGTPPKPAATLGVHSSSNGFDFSRNVAFGYAGEAFIAQFGDMSPGVGKVLSPVGFKVVRVDPSTGIVHDFAVNRGKTNGPASRLKTGGLERPVAARFNNSGTVLYVVDFGVMTVGDDPQPMRGTGVLWRITRTVENR